MIEMDTSKKSKIFKIEKIPNKSALDNGPLWLLCGVYYFLPQSG